MNIQKTLSKTLFGALALSAILYAQDIDENVDEIQSASETQSNMDSFTELNITTFVLGKMLSSSTGFDLPLGDEARNVVIIEKEDFTNKGYTSLAQALQYQPLLTFNDNGFGSNIDLRGQGTDANRAVKILVNRVPINLLDTSHGVTPYNNINIDDIESIEIIPGGGAVVYGNGTRGGIINIVTKKYLEDFARVILKATSGEGMGLQGGSLSLTGSKRISDNLFIRGDIQGSYTPGVRNGKSDVTKSNKNDNMTNLYAASQILYEINGNHKIDFNISYSHSWVNFPSGSSTAANNKYLTFECSDYWSCQALSDNTSPSPYTGKYEVDSVITSLNYNAKLSDTWSFDLLAFYQFNDVDYTKYDYILSGGTPFDQTGSGFENHGGGLNLKLKHETNSNTFIIGLDNVLEHSNRRNYINHIVSQSAAAILGYEVDLNNKATKLSDSLYIYDIIKFDEKWSLGLGARGELSTYWTTNDQYFDFVVIIGQEYHTIEETSRSFDTTRFAYALEVTPSYKYSSTGNVYAKAESGFISPSAYQMINADKDFLGTQLYDNYYNHIKTEQYITGELGWKDEFGPNYFSATIFYTHTFNEIYNNLITHGTNYSYGNLGETQRAGFELLGRHHFGDSHWFRISEGISYIYTNVLKANVANEYLLHKQIPYVPRLKVTLNLEADVYDANDQTLTLYLNNAYYSSSTALGCVGGMDSYGECANDNKYEITMNKGGYLLMDLGATYRNGNITIGAGVKNLLDEFYVYYQKDTNYVRAMGRNYYVELKYDF